tara:strand:+ start:227 stop:490 length:264 start_codon:yes stop_codon:yes gene_type:complete
MRVYENSRLLDELRLMPIAKEYASLSSSGTCTPFKNLSVCLKFSGFSVKLVPLRGDCILTVEIVNRQLAIFFVAKYTQLYTITAAMY